MTTTKPARDLQPGDRFRTTTPTDDYTGPVYTVRRAAILPSGRVGVWTSPFGSGENNRPTMTFPADAPVPLLLPVPLPDALRTIRQLEADVRAHDTATAPQDATTRAAFILASNALRTAHNALRLLRSLQLPAAIPPHTGRFHVQHPPAVQLRWEPAVDGNPGTAQARLRDYVITVYPPASVRDAAYVIREYTRNNGIRDVVSGTAPSTSHAKYAAAEAIRDLTTNDDTKEAYGL